MQVFFSAMVEVIGLLIRLQVMKVYAERVVETVVDRVCDVCNVSVMNKIGEHKYEECGELKANWGYGSKNDGKSYHLDLCESCFQKALFSLRDHRRSIVMFDDAQELPNDQFGITKE